MCVHEGCVQSWLACKLTHTILIREKKLNSVDPMEEFPGLQNSETFLPALSHLRTHGVLLS